MTYAEIQPPPEATGGSARDIAAVWKANASRLSTWTMERLVNRSDAWGLYVRWTDNGHEHRTTTAPAKKDRGKVLLTLAVLEGHFCGLPGQIIGLHTVSPNNACLWFSFDFDNHNHDPEVAARNLQQAMLLVEHLRDYGFTAILEDSNGDGGYHVWVLLSARAPSNVVYAFVQKLIEELGITAEGFPKQPEIASDGYGNFLRVPGKHHSGDHWSRIYSYGRWLVGQEAIDALIDAPLSDVLLLPDPPADDEVRQTAVINSELRPRTPGAGRRLDADIALDCLNHLGADVADDRTSWIKIGQILHDIDPMLFGEWDRWSRQSAKFRDGECASKWKGFGRRSGRKATLGTLVYMARRAGAAIRFFEVSEPMVSSGRVAPQDEERPVFDDEDSPPPADQLTQITQRAGGGSNGKSSKPPVRPEVTLPGGATEINEAAGKLGPLLAATTKLFVRGGAIVALAKDDKGEIILRPVKNATLPSAFERVAKLVKLGDEGELLPATCTEQCAKVIASSEAFLSAMPPIKLLSPCPVLVERGGQLITITGYDRDSGIYASGGEPDDVSLDDAVILLNCVLQDFRFATESDRARAIAALITPALVFGDLLGGRAPVDLGEADASQSGKGYRNRLNAAIYRTVVQAVTQKKGGVGSLEESFNSKLIRGAAFISIDNVRGAIDSPAIESFLTEDSYSARMPFQPDVEIDPRRIVLQLTSNKADITVDLANRSSCVRILKQPQDYAYASFPEGDILDHVRANQPRFLGAVFAVVRAWYAAGKPLSDEVRHDFRKWAKTIDWIVQNLLGQAPLLDGHRETQQRMANPSLNWLRDVALAVKRDGRLGCRLHASELLDILAADGTVEIPGIPADGNIESEPRRKSALQAVGKRLGHCFKNDSSASVDGLNIERLLEHDIVAQRDNKIYVFSLASESGTSPDAQEATRGTSGKNGFHDAPADGKRDISPDVSPDQSPDDSPDNSSSSPDSPDGAYRPITAAFQKQILSVTDHQGSQGKNHVFSAPNYESVDDHPLRGRRKISP